MRKTKRTPKRRVTVMSTCWNCHNGLKSNCLYCHGSGWISHKEQLILCIGGVHDKYEMPWSKVKDEGYIQFNSSGRGKIRSAVYLHESILAT